MANSDLAFAQLFWELMNRKTGDLGRVEYKPQKPSFDLSTPIAQPFPRSTPEAQGVDSAWLAGLVRDLAGNQRINPHELMILRHHHVIYEGAFDPYRTGVWHVTYSMCKSFTGMAIGLLVDEGRLKLTDYVLDILKPSRGYLGSLLMQMKFGALTIRDLLVMSSGVGFNEVGAISGNDWTQSYFEAKIKFEPGSRFEYNSMNSYILSAVVTELTGKTMFEYLREKLFIPMGISKVFWESSPEGITKGGWGMFLTQEDAAKLGTLYLDKGRWNGQQLISEEWVAEATKPQIETGREDTPYYGYQLWMNNMPGSFLYNGMLGQNVYVYPSLDMIIVINCGNDEVFQGGTLSKVIRSYLNEDYHPSEEPLPENPEGRAALAAAGKVCPDPLCARRERMGGGWGQPRIRRQFQDAFLSQINGCIYEMKSKGVGLFPLIMQVVHTNYTNGISALKFELRENVLYLLLKEGPDIYSIPVGFGRSRHTAVTVKGEEYLVGTQARLGLDEDDKPVLTLRIAFIEEATERLLRIRWKSFSEIALYWDETPGNDIIQHILEMITTGSGNTNFIVDSILNRMNPELLQNAMKTTIEPVVQAELVTMHAAADDGTAQASGAANT